MADQFNLSPELAKQALEEFGETPEKRTVALSALRARIAALPAADQLADTTDANIIRFLRARKYDIDKALESTKQFKHFQDKFADVIAAPGLQKLVLMSKDFLEVFREPNGGKVYVAMRPKMGLPNFTPKLKAESPRGESAPLVFPLFLTSSLFRPAFLTPPLSLPLPLPLPLPLLL